jgi:hypothetical protein
MSKNKIKIWLDCPFKRLDRSNWRVASVNTSSYPVKKRKEKHLELVASELQRPDKS